MHVHLERYRYDAAYGAGRIFVLTVGPGVTRHIHTHTHTHTHTCTHIAYAHARVDIHTCIYTCRYDDAYGAVREYIL